MTDDAQVGRNARHRSANLERRKAAVAMKLGGMSYREVSDAMGVTEETVKRWVREDAPVLMPSSTRAMKMSTPDPVPFNALPMATKEVLKDFGQFRWEYLERRAAPWAVDASEVVINAWDNRHPVDRQFILMNVAPGLGKSTLFTHDLVVWLVTYLRSLGRMPRFLLGAMAEKRARTYIHRLHKTFTRNVHLIEAFGRYRPSETQAGPWNNLELTIEPIDWTTQMEKEATITGAGLDTEFLGGRFDINIWDDPVSKRNSQTPHLRDQLVKDFETEAETRTEPGGLFILQGSRYLPEDLYKNRRDLVVRKPDGEVVPMYRHITYPAHVEETCDGQTHYGPWPKGCLLDPTRLSWNDIYREMEKNEGRFRLVYQQEDSDPIGHLAEKPWFEGGKDSTGLDCIGSFDRDRGFGQLPDYRDDTRPVFSIVTVDPSIENYWALMHVVLYSNEDRVVLRGMRRPLHAPDILYRNEAGEFVGILEDWWEASRRQGVPITHVVMEERVVGKHMNQYEFVSTWQQRRGVVIMKHDTNRSNKPDEVRGVDMLRPLYRTGRWRLPYLGHDERLFADQYVREAVAYPEGNTDDLVMASWFVEFNMPTLKIVSQKVPKDQGGNAPPWARSRVPSWAAAALSGSGGR